MAFETCICYNLETFYDTCLLIGAILITDSALLRINIGNIVNQAIGYSRDYLIELPKFSFGDDLIIHDLEGNFTISRTTEGLLVQTRGQAKTALECVYCLDSFLQELAFSFIEMYSFPSNAIEDTELIIPDDQQIDFTPLIREYLLLEIPINPVCKTECKGLCPICGENLNTKSCDHKDEPIDPRLSVLKTLLDDDSPGTP